MRRSTFLCRDASSPQTLNTIHRSPRHATSTRETERWHPLHLHLHLNSPRYTNTTPQSRQMMLHLRLCPVFCSPLLIKTFPRADHESRLNGPFVLRHPYLHLQRKQNRILLHKLNLRHLRVFLLVVMNAKHFPAVSLCEDSKATEED